MFIFFRCLQETTDGSLLVCRRQPVITKPCLHLEFHKKPTVTASSQPQETLWTTQLAAAPQRSSSMDRQLKNTFLSRAGLQTLQLLTSCLPLQAAFLFSQTAENDLQQLPLNISSFPRVLDPQPLMSLPCHFRHTANVSSAATTGELQQRPQHDGHTTPSAAASTAEEPSTSSDLLQRHQAGPEQFLTKSPRKLCLKSLVPLPKDWRIPHPPQPVPSSSDNESTAIQRGNKVPARATPSKDNEFTEIQRTNKAPPASPETSRNEESFQRVEQKRHKQQLEKSRFIYPQRARIKQRQPAPAPSDDWSKPIHAKREKIDGPLLQSSADRRSSQDKYPGPRQSQYSGESQQPQLESSYDSCVHTWNASDEKIQPLMH